MEHAEISSVTVRFQSRTTLSKKTASDANSDMSASPFPIAFQLEPEGEDERRRRYDPTEPEYWMQLPPETEPVEAAPSYPRHAFLMTRGTRGDVQPFVALARGPAVG